MVSTLTPNNLPFSNAFATRDGRPPTYRDLATQLGHDAVGTVQDHVRTLMRKGFLEKEDGVSRGFRLAYQRGTQEIPVLGSVPAGNPIEAIQDTQGSVAVPAKLRGEHFALRVVGESMIDAGILDGDTVIVKNKITLKTETSSSR